MLDPKPDSTLKTEPVLFFSALALILVTCIPIILYQDKALTVLIEIRKFFTGPLGWMFLLFGVSSVLFLVWMIFGPYRNVKLGGKDEEPEFSTISWIAMLFCCGIGTGLIYWAFIEPIYYLQSPPFGIAPGTVEAKEWAAAYGIFHWGYVPWAITCGFGIPIAYSYYVRKTPRLSIGAAFDGHLGKHTWFTTVVDLLVMLAILGNVVTVLGLGTPMLSATIAKFIGIEPSFHLDLTVVAIWTILFCCSCYFGLKKGIKLLSNLNLVLALAVMVLVLSVGPTSFILNTFMNSLGLVFQNTIRMCFNTDTVGATGWPQDWTIFFWAWWLGAAPFVGVFLAKISKGRTLRQMAIAPLVWGPLGCAIFFGVFGGYSLHTELFGEQSMTTMMAAMGPAKTIATMIAALPLGQIMLPLFIVLMFIFCATTLDSASYVLATVSTKELPIGTEPARWNRMFWSVINGVAAISLMLLGGLKPLQAVAVLTAFPLMFIMLGAGYFLVKDLKFQADLEAGTVPTMEYLKLQTELEEIATQSMEPVDKKVLVTPGTREHILA
ncbi:OpuD4 [Desulforapulum autotrophicum HRM2]|uniref:OpuD4 n=1 Tax=Desulforapulum autotrophicum (strain ATCC 43914 / DSM 3382 / VKM B-1955 / HRM2) TaxID=177437 RepID=C0QKF5_DESAH|nr:BCCT family transporter [Desulforapulum autotrophicum]ACN14026.1 OpuD4 [Desulforapulum autotrophicum HRM2]